MTTHTFEDLTRAICSGCCVPAEAIEDGLVGPQCEGPKTYSEYKANRRIVDLLERPLRPGPGSATSDTYAREQSRKLHDTIEKWWGMDIGRDDGDGVALISAVHPLCVVQEEAEPALSPDSLEEIEIQEELPVRACVLFNVMQMSNYGCPEWTDLVGKIFDGEVIEWSDCHPMLGLPGRYTLTIAQVEPRT